MIDLDNCRTEPAPVEPWDAGAPKINGPKIFAASPGNPLFQPLAVSGARPLEFKAEGLPAGLAIDSSTGLITGSAGKIAHDVASVTVTNVHGADTCELEIVIGGPLALTPPLGWNCFNCWGREIDADKVRAAADAMVSSGLAAHGYNYVNIDEGRQGNREGNGALQPNEKFPDMQGLCDYVHGLGLRIGIYSTPWVKSYAGYTGGSTGRCVRSDRDKNRIEEGGRYFGETPCHNQDVAQWARWGIDYLKYDWGPWKVPDVQAMSEALAGCGRDIVYSLSNSAPFDGAADWARLGNCWRTTGDITDTWDSLQEIAFSQDRWTPYACPGHWNDPDMLVVGRLGWGKVRENRLTRDEQITHITMWAVLAAPMLAGCDLTGLDDFTIRLLCNDEVLAVNQDSGGEQGYCIRELRRSDESGRNVVHQCVYRRHLADPGAPGLAVAMFNRADAPAVVEVSWDELGVSGPRTVRNLWARKDAGVFDGAFAAGVPAHGAQLFRVSA